MKIDKYKMQTRNENTKIRALYLNIINPISLKLDRKLDHEHAS